MIFYIIFFVIAALLSFCITPLIIKYAKKWNLLDHPSERKIHQKPIPLLGGVSIFIAFNIVIFIAHFMGNSYVVDLFETKWVAFLCAQLFIIGIGIIDDIKHLQPWKKLIFQALAGIILVASGFGIQNISSPFTGDLIHLGLFSIPISILWVIGITNALNLVDGLDGLSAGTAFIVCITISSLGYFNQNLGIAFISLVLAGSILGFLRYNFHPAKIFLGDSGSLYLGFLLSVFSIESSSKGATLVALLAPLIALGFPIFDTLVSMIRRLLRSIRIVDYPNGNGSVKALFTNGFSVFEADKDHVHHRLMKFGFSHKRAVILLYGLGMILGVIAFISVAFKDINAFILLGAIVAAIFIGIKSLKYDEFRILENGLLLPLFNLPVLSKKIFHAFYDLVVIGSCFYLSYFLIYSVSDWSEYYLLLSAIPPILVVKILIFYFTKLYRLNWTYLSVEGILSILKSVSMSSIISFIILFVWYDLNPLRILAFSLLDFYLVFSGIISLRFSFRIISSYYRNGSKKSGKKVLIYGAGYRGSTVLREIKHDNSQYYMPLGFIDDDFNKKGMALHNCPVLGSFEDVEDIVKKNNVSEIIISTSKIGKQKIEGLKKFCQQQGVLMRQFEFRFYEFPNL